MGALQKETNRYAALEPCFLWHQRGEKKSWLAVAAWGSSVSVQTLQKPVLYRNLCMHCSCMAQGELDCLVFARSWKRSKSTPAKGFGPWKRVHSFHKKKRSSRCRQQCAKTYFTSSDPHSAKLFCLLSWFLTSHLEIQSGIYSEILFELGSAGPQQRAAPDLSGLAMHAEIRSSQLGSWDPAVLLLAFAVEARRCPLRSGISQSNLMLVVEVHGEVPAEIRSPQLVGKCALRSGGGPQHFQLKSEARGWGPAVPTRLRSRQSAHSLRSGAEVGGARSWGPGSCDPTARTEIWSLERIRGERRRKELW